MLGISFGAVVGKMMGMGGGLKRGAEKRSIRMPSRFQFSIYSLFSATLCRLIFDCTLQLSLPICLPPRSLKRLQKHSRRRCDEAVCIILALEKERI